jgi:hypothetical protein
VRREPISAKPASNDEVGNTVRLIARESQPELEQSGGKVNDADCTRAPGVESCECVPELSNRVRKRLLVQLLLLREAGAQHVHG